MTTKYTCSERDVTLAPLTPKGFMDGLCSRQNGEINGEIACKIIHDY